MTTIDFLPDDATGNALRQFLMQGSSLHRPMSIDFFAQVPSEDAGSLVARDVRYLGFDASVEYDEETNQWTCYCTKSIVPRYETVVRIEKQIDSIAQRYGGRIDGFGSYGNAENGIR